MRRRLHGVATQLQLAYAAMQTVEGVERLEPVEPADIERQPLLGGANAAAGAHRAR